jgi:glycine cleavage system H protein
MNVPTNLKYTKDHEWVLIKGNEATIGILILHSMNSEI